MLNMSFFANLSSAAGFTKRLQINAEIPEKEP